MNACSTKFSPDVDNAMAVGITSATSDLLMR